MELLKETRKKLLEIQEDNFFFYKFSGRWRFFKHFKLGYVYNNLFLELAGKYNSHLNICLLFAFVSQENPLVEK